MTVRLPLNVSRRQILAGMGAAALAGGSSMLWGGAVLAQEGKVLRVQNRGDIRNLDPARRGGWYDETIQFAIFSGLCQYNVGDEWGWHLDAAERLEQVDPTTIEFALKPGILWTNGFGEVTAEDVKFSYERFADPEVNAVYASDWVALETVEVTGPYTGVIHLKSPFAPLFTSTLPHASGAIISKAALEKAGSKIIATDPFASSGPYRLEEWLPRERITLVRNELWTGKEVYYDEIQLFPISDLTAAEVAFDAGDLAAATINASSIASREGGTDAKFYKKAELGYTWLGMNVLHPKLEDVRVRRAIQQGIDVDEVLLATFGGAVTRAYGIVPPPLLGARDSLLYPYNPEESRRLLKEAGAEGLSIMLEFGADADHLVAAQVMQAQLLDVGIALDVRQSDGSALTSERQDNAGGGWKRTELFFNSFTTAPDPSWVTEWFTCAQVGVWNFQRTCDEAWDAQHVAAASEPDQSKRAEMYIDLQNKLEETGAFLFLYHGVNAWLARPDLDLPLTPDGQWIILRDIAPVA